MKIKVERKFRGDTYTIGHMYLNYEDGKGFEYFCDTLEDKCRIINGDCSMKIFAETAIPEGTYDVEMLWWTKHNNWYPHIKDVKCFTGIMIHSGTNEADTQGCILVGFNKVKGQVIGGIDVMQKLRTILNDCKDRQETISIMVF